ncbi:HAD family hydrolase [Streptomyces hainanensis]|uniref:HAD family hydrolase n=1 Tax=Streptomyces hainanensis TaxID=402648 RepID=A0A4R4TM96_9ACTN|nr:HAD family hydrolase [Streptomyces hainanensis]TDC79208.1 HAD family hydrolase [Streptomyces hainanensis]
MRRPVRAVVFDLDGTLVDSWRTHAHCLRFAAAAVGVGRPSAVRLFGAQRPTETGTLRELVGPDQLVPARQAYEEALRAALATDPVSPMPGAVAVLAGLRRHGVAAGVCTGRSRLTAQALLDSCGLAVPLTVASDDVARPKPEPDALVLALARLSVDAPDAVFVGDSAWDAAQGTAAGVRTVVVGASGPPAALGEGAWLLDPLPLPEESAERGGARAGRAPLRGER